MGKILKQQQQQEVSQQVRMPVNGSNSDVVSTVSSTTAWNGTISYYNSGVLTTDAGQVAGTAVVIKLAYNNILNAVGSMVGGNQDTSFAFVTGTILTTRVDFPYGKMESNATASGADLLSAITSGFANGEYCIDHENGIIYGVKATNGTTDTCSYKITSGATSGGGAGTQDVIVVPGSDFDTGTVSITTAGVAQQITATSTPILAVAIQGHRSNTGFVLVGNATNQLWELEAGQSIVIPIDNLNKVYLDVTVSGEDANYMIIEE